MPSTLSKELARRRKALGLTKYRCAKAAGVSWPVWNRVERGETVPSVDRLAAFARALGCRPVFDAEGNVSLEPLTTPSPT